MHVVNTLSLITVLILLFYSLLLCIVYFVYLNVLGPQGRWPNAHWVYPLEIKILL